jgi:hypothetical protein
MPADGGFFLIPPVRAKGNFSRRRRQRDSRSSSLSKTAAPTQLLVIYFRVNKFLMCEVAVVVDDADF